MKILLVHPYKTEESYLYAVPQIGLGYLSAALKKNGFFDIKIVDFQILKFDLHQVKNVLETEKPDILGIYFWSSHISVVRDYVKICRDLFGNKIKIIIGGPHPSVFGKEATNKIDGIDFGFRGEAEESFPQLIKKLSSDIAIDCKNIPGLIWQDGEKNWQVNEPIFKKEIDEYSIDWPALNLYLYHEAEQRSPNFDRGDDKKVKNGFLFCSRGCPYHCKYCSASIISGSTIRYFTPKSVINNIHHLYHNYGVRHFNIMDDNFTFDKKYVMEFCNEYLKNPLEGVTFASPNGIRADRLDEEIVAMMKKCGWIKIMVGIESGSSRILNSMRKSLNLEQVKKGVELINKYGIQSWGFFILGYPGETKETIKETINFALNLPLTWASFSIFNPIPCTEIFNELIAKGIINKDYEMQGYHSLNVSFSELTSAELRQAQRIVYFKFYSRPKKLINVLKGTSLTFLLKTGLSILKK